MYIPINVKIVLFLVSIVNYGFPKPITYNHIKVNKGLLHVACRHEARYSFNNIIRHSLIHFIHRIC